MRFESRTVKELGPSRDWVTLGTVGVEEQQLKMESRSFVQSDEEFDLDGSAYTFEPEYTDEKLQDMERRQRGHVTEFVHQGVVQPVQPVQPATTAMYPNPGMVAGESSTPCIFSFGFHNWEMHRHEPFSQ